MNKLSFFILSTITFLGSFDVQAQSITRKVLFLGNSYTSTNNLPQLVSDMAASVGDNLIFDSHLPGGYLLTQHYTNTLSTSKVMAGGWDYVVLQEQSQTPALPNGNFNLGAHQLSKLIKEYNPCAQPLFYMTWGRQNGDALNCPLYPEMCTYLGMDSLIRKSYKQQAINNNAEISPVSAVWRYIRQNYPSIGLYQPDESHPSVAGSYAAACCFYSVIFKKNPLLITYNASLNAADAAFIRTAAKAVAFDSLTYWSFKVNPTAFFNYTVGGGVNEAIFNYQTLLPGLNPLANTFTWDFGDGFTTTLVNPVNSAVNHSYLSNGTYTVKLTVSNCDVSGTQQAVYQTTISFCNHTPTIFKTYPWYCAPVDTISTQVYTAYQWYDNFGNPILGQVNKKLPLLNSNSFYSVLTTQNGCSEMSQPYYNNSGPGVIPHDVDVVGPLTGSNTACDGSNLSLIVTELAGSESIQWFKNGLLVSSANTPTLSFNASGTYSVNLFHTNCPNYIFYSKTLTFSFIDCAIGVKVNKANTMGIVIYPNPTSDHIAINSLEDIDVVELYNTRSEKVYSKTVTGKLSNEEINLSNYAKGVYVIKIRNSKAVFTKKIIVK